MTRRWHADAVADLLWAAALGLAVIAAAARLWPASASTRVLPSVVTASTPAGPSRGGSPATLGADALVDAVARADPFSAGRTAPRVRWAPPAPDTLPLGLAPDPLAMAAMSGPSAERTMDGPPRFYGTVIDPQGAAALLWLDARVPGAQLYREGARAAGWRVLRVTPERVLLATPGGERITLRLARERSQAPADSAPADSTRSVP